MMKPLSPTSLAMGGLPSGLPGTEPAFLLSPCPSLLMAGFYRPVLHPATIQYCAGNDNPDRPYSYRVLFLPRANILLRASSTLPNEDNRSP